ncbi:hypothetical protein GbCGDNIH3_8104 [Granulibacter bethesdensis]|uniref:Uncharacterized protein n=2 Tax=Granulibacter bethesdensis TaxID=364410 RepID=A0A286M2Y6_GRABC|nr:hypothetical protein GbCGDNIH3_8104 [Granulibacter bethesdensis]ASV62385.1 hypothetical protein GbCGDNIH1_8104 [Granulibacter bethesdensis CGDNIH1]ASV62545.1 hypothetical protein GbCGDNIH1I4_8104 [Granulibacter bethesdensis]
MVSWQVSWLTGHCLRSCLPEAEASVTSVDAGSPLTVAGAAPALLMRTGFPLGSGVRL